MFKLGAIGAGNMGLAILEGAVKCGAVKSSEIIVFDPIPEKIRISKEKGFSIAESEAMLFKNCEYLLFAVIPQVYKEVLTKLKGLESPEDQVVISIAAGISSKYIQSFLGEKTKVVNAMPNTPLRIGLGATVLARTANVGDTEFDKIKGIFSSMGEVAVMEEKMLAESVPANGSSPAYVYYFIDCIARSLEKRGVDKETAIRLIAKSFIGSAQMLLETGKTPEELIEQVCTPGGLTIETIKVFDKKDLFSIIDEGCSKCVERGYELSL